jgi:hypothetical protein
MARLQRDAALERIRSATRAIGIASVALVAAFGIYISRAVPGHTSTPAGSTAASNSVNPSTGSSPSGGQSTTNLSPPSQAPTPVQQQAPVVSGSS